MSERIQLNLTRLGLAVGIFGGIIGIGGTFVVLPYRLEAAEKRITSLEEQVASSRELLVRIDENVKALKEAKR
jgi:hypothetical protein